MPTDKKILIIITGGIAAYKTLELIRLLRKKNATVTCILTKGGEQFVTPLSVASLSGNKVYTDLWSLNDESEMGHIRLSREHDLILVAPSSADFIAKMANGLANDLASTTLLASDKPVMIAPAMNPEMWKHPATRSNIQTLKERNVLFCGPETGEMACGETGPGRMSEAETIFSAVTDFFLDKPLKGKKAVVTSGPTFEPIDPVRFIGNRSSGKQGHAIAQALNDAGAEVTLISGPVNIPAPSSVHLHQVQTAKEMLDASLKSLPADIFISVAAVSDWTPASPASQKIKKENDHSSFNIDFKQNPDILKNIASLKSDTRPRLVIGFAAETENVKANAQEKIKRKGCDWVIANYVGTDQNGKKTAFGADENEVFFVTHENIEKWARSAKSDIARNIAERIVKEFDNGA